MAAATGDSPILEIGDLTGSLNDPALLAGFREFLRAVDGKAKAGPNFRGRFERCLDFVVAFNSIYALPENQGKAVISQLEAVHKEFLACSPSQRISVVSQLALKRLNDHIKALVDGTVEVPDLSLTRAIYDDVFRKLQQRHDVWKKTYKPKMSLQALLCLLS